MRYVIQAFLLSFIHCVSFVIAEAPTVPPDADAIIKEAVNYWRGSSSYAEATMHIHRSDWDREMSFKGWTKGEDFSLVRFTAPAKDNGNATLVRAREMWSFAPNISRTIKIPPSMMSQSWMGSDFSHSDLSKQKDIIDRYSHKLLSIEAIPNDDAAVVWGKEILKVRSDKVILERAFYDQEMKLVKALHATDIQKSGSVVYARIARMENAEKPDEWTQVTYQKILFDISISDDIFSQGNISEVKN